MNLTIEEFTKENLALALYGNHVVGTPGTVTAEPGGRCRADLRVTATSGPPEGVVLVVVGFSGTPATPGPGTNYPDVDFGASSFWIPPASPRRSGQLCLRCRHRDRHLHQALPERYLRLEGINTAQGNAKVLVELYRVAFDPLKEISFIRTSTTSSNWKARCWPTPPSL